MSVLQVQEIINTDERHARLIHDQKFSDGVAFTQGEYRPVAEGVVPVTDMGFIHADAAYDVVSVSRGQFFRLQDHLDRIRASCEKFNLENPYSDAETTEILNNCVKLAGLRDAYVWWCVTRGQMLSDRSSSDFDYQFYAFVTPYMFIFGDEERTRGVDLHISTDFVRIAPDAVDPTAKNFHWMDMKLAIFEAQKSGANWPVLTDGNGVLTESPGSNIFLIKDGVIKTPALGCLEGITRQTVLELAGELGVPVEAGAITADELLGADEAFLTSTAGGIMPASHINGNAMNGRNGPGELSTQIHNLYWNKRWDGWLGTPVDYQ